jgi:hypothetical protein
VYPDVYYSYISPNKAHSVIDCLWHSMASFKVSCQMLFTDSN